MLTLKDALVFGRIFTEIKKSVLRFHFIQNENKFIILVCMTTVSLNIIQGAMVINTSGDI